MEQAAPDPSPDAWIVGDPSTTAYRQPVPALIGERRSVAGRRVVSLTARITRPPQIGRATWFLLDPAIGTTSDFAPDEVRVEIPEIADYCAVVFTTRAAAERELAVREIDKAIIDTRCVLESLENARAALVS